MASNTTDNVLDKITTMRNQTHHLLRQLWEASREALPEIFLPEPFKGPHRYKPGTFERTMTTTTTTAIETSGSPTRRQLAAAYSPVRSIRMASSAAHSPSRKRTASPTKKKQGSGGPGGGAGSPLRTIISVPFSPAQMLHYQKEHRDKAVRTVYIYVKSCDAGGQG